MCLPLFEELPWIFKKTTNSTIYLAMRKVFLILLFNYLSVNLLQAQDAGYKWVATMDGATGRSEVFSMNIDKDGNILTTGFFEDSLDADPDTGKYILRASNYSYYVQKLNPQRKLLWAIEISNYISYDLIALTSDPWGNVIITGSNSSFKSFILKLDENGKKIWEINLKPRNNNSFTSIKAGLGITTDKKGNVYATGSFADSTDFNPGNDSFFLDGGMDGNIYILKLDSHANFIWAKTLDGLGSYDRSSDIEVDSFQNVFLSGTFSDRLDFDPDTTVYNLFPFSLPPFSTHSDIFILKLDSGGHFQWVRQAGGRRNDIIVSMVLDAKGNIYSTGNYGSIADFDPDTSIYNLTITNYYQANAQRDVFIWKLDSTGKFCWAKSVGSKSDDEGHSIAIDQLNNVYLTGYFTGDGDFNPLSTDTFILYINNGSSYILKLDSSGKFVWAKNIRTLSSNVIGVDNSLNIYSAGQVDGSTCFDPRRKVNCYAHIYSDDAYILKLQTCTPNDTVIYASSCDSFTFLNKKYYTSGAYTKVLNNVTNCDSLITLNLTIFTHSSDTIKQSACDSFIFNGISYFASGIYTQKLMNVAGCDSNITLDLKILNSTSTLSISNCDSLTLNGISYYKTGTYAQHLTNFIGCDSLLIIRANIGHTTTTSTNINVCYSYLWLGNTYTQSGTYTGFLKSQAGCDSTAIIHLFISDSTFSYYTIKACNTYTMNGHKYTKSGIYKQQLLNYNGCDSILTLDLTINNSTSSLISKTACTNYIFNNKLYSVSGVYKDTLTNSAGCDSLVTLNLTIIKLDNSVTINGWTLTSNLNGAKYQWLDCQLASAAIIGETQKAFTASQKGIYSVKVTNLGCTDTSLCYQINNIGDEYLVDNEFVNIYPNPLSDRFIINFKPNLDNNILISIKNISGQEVYHQQLQVGSRNQEIEMNGPSGIYLLTIITKEKTFILKLIKE
jgi:hypothetical protein